jgi:hypothetical protein
MLVDQETLKSPFYDEYLKAFEGFERLSGWQGYKGKNYPKQTKFTPASSTKSLGF